MSKFGYFLYKAIMSLIAVAIIGLVDYPVPLLLFLILIAVLNDNDVQKDG